MRPGLEGSSALDWNRTNDTGFRRAVLYPLSYEGGRPGPAKSRSVSDTDISIQGERAYYALGMTAATTGCPRTPSIIPDVAATRFYVGALAKLSVLQYFVAEAAVIGAWAGQNLTAAAPATSATWAPWPAGSLTAGTSARRPTC